MTNIDQLCDQLFNAPTNAPAPEVELSEQGKAICDQIHTMPIVEKNALKNPVTGVPFEQKFTCNRQDNGQIIGNIVSANYVVPTLDDLCTIAMAATEGLGVDCVAQTVFRDGHHIIVSASDETRRETVGGDGLTPRLTIHSLLGGKSTLNTGLAAGNDVCDNLMMFRSVAEVTHKIRHCGRFEEHFSEMVDDFGQLAARFDDFVSVANQLHSKKVIVADMLQQIFPKAEHTTQGKNQIESILRRLVEESQRTNTQLVQGQTTAFRLFNAIQGHLQHDSSRKGNPGRVEKSILVNTSPTNVAIVTKAERLLLAV